MIALSNLVLVGALYAVPCEYVIDFGAEAGPFAYKMVLSFEARDGTYTNDLIAEWSENTDPGANRTDLALSLKTIGWATRPGPGNSFVVTGRLDGKKSPIKSVTLKSEKPIPVTLRWMPLAPEKKK